MLEEVYNIIKKLETKHYQIFFNTFYDTPFLDIEFTNKKDMKKFLKNIPAYGVSVDWEFLKVSIHKGDE